MCVFQFAIPSCKSPLNIFFLHSSYEIDVWDYDVLSKVPPKLCVWMLCISFFQRSPKFMTPERVGLNDLFLFIYLLKNIYTG